MARERQSLVGGHEFQTNPDNPNNLVNSKASDVTKHVIATVPEIQIKTKLKQILDERKMSQAELGRLTGIPRNQINAFVNNKEGKSLGYHHIMAIMIALRLTDISQLLYVEMNEETVDQFNKEREMWIETRREPESINRLALENKQIV